MRFNLRHIVPFALLWLGCGAEPSVSEALPAQAEELAQEQSMLRDFDCSDCLKGTEGARLVGGFSRERVVDDIYHYSVDVRVGPTVYDTITLHRVVRERRVWSPKKGSEAVFMVHGDAWDFRGAFMASTQTSAVPVDHSIAVYLAQRGVDVWGIDLRWTHVPLGTEDFSFMKNWDLGMHARDVGTGLTVARAVRALTGNGGGKVNLLGWSRGAMVAYAYLNAETQLPPGLRNVSGFIPVDMVVKFGPEGESQRQWACARAELAKVQLEAGRVEGGLLGAGAGVAIKLLGEAAIAYPDEPANLPPLPPLPNKQLAITLGAATFSFISAPELGVQPTVPVYHFNAGQFGEGGDLTALRYVKERQFFDFMRSAHPFQSFKEIVESEQLLCGQEDLPYDDHLNKISVPVLHVGAAGGFGSYGEHLPKNLLGSRDVTVKRVQRESNDARFADFGHADLFLAEDAPEHVWEPIYKWMKRH
ncbi:alpha/beta hydrolase [Archangium lipolyticum]|uniref:alpha/beta hydrolase n=1 Tax=Archangium lipolyticum TaxID=2970465 RepID=UPI00214A387A|nr:alpha/beta hydrolase [Archangium lipolyticum]